ncbi:hypothetical protein Esi_0238_0010 [Ectocarpus siliculosus]|uniref:Uncharacterized protein n=1 Tax=Ectocarpus siliculosus TaxID=2880 RepID=D7FSP9_ECTSI|nr:hypothetical protein Esi_0238_0010 [Ectocarpus siliculosus]|eukprot:CBJ31190.1 hypothetical protein Esi_0238_0010 [Ectocarpus siliculosus]
MMALCSKSSRPKGPRQLSDKSFGYASASALLVADTAMLLLARRRQCCETNPQLLRNLLETSANEASRSAAAHLRCEAGTYGRGAALTAVAIACGGLLGLALLWRAVRLAAFALGDGAAHVDDTLVYMEEFCAVGSLAAMTATVWLLHRDRTDGVRAGSSRFQDEVESGDEGGALDDASWLSMISFSWLNQLFRTGAARQLRAEDLPQLARQDRAAVWADKCERAT